MKVLICVALVLVAVGLIDSWWERRKAKGKLYRGLVGLFADPRKRPFLEIVASRAGSGNDMAFLDWKELEEVLDPAARIFGERGEPFLERLRFFHALAWKGRQEFGQEKQEETAGSNIEISGEPTDES